MGASIHKVTLRPLSTGSPVAAARVTRRSPQELLEEEAARQAAQASGVSRSTVARSSFSGSR